MGRESTFSLPVVSPRQDGTGRDSADECDVGLLSRADSSSVEDAAMSAILARRYATDVLTRAQS